VVKQTNKVGGVAENKLVTSVIPAKLAEPIKLTFGCKLE